MLWFAGWLQWEDLYPDRKEALLLRQEGLESRSHSLAQARAVAFRGRSEEAANRSRRNLPQSEGIRATQSPLARRERLCRPGVGRSEEPEVGEIRSAHSSGVIDHECGRG